MQADDDPKPFIWVSNLAPDEGWKSAVTTAAMMIIVIVAVVVLRREDRGEIVFVAAG